MDQTGAYLVDEVLPLLCLECQQPMRVVLFITEGKDVAKILGHLGEAIHPPELKPARGPPYDIIEE